MKILFLGVFDKISTNNSQSNALKRIGYDVIEYDVRQRQRELKLSYDRDSEIISICRIERPDIVFFSKCNELNIRVVEECNKISKTILWYMDPKNINYSEILIQKIKKCDFTFCTLTEPYKESCKYTNNCYFIQEGFDPTCNYYIDSIAKRVDVSFIGTLRGKRKEYYNKIKFKNYNNYHGKKHSIAVCESRINLNFTEGGTSDRTYKVLSSKGFLLTESWPNMENDFEDGVDFVTFNNMDDLVSKIDYYLKHPEKIEEISTNGYNKVQKFSRDNIMKKIIDMVSV